jgi:hypothetical protein
MIGAREGTVSDEKIEAYERIIAAFLATCKNHEQWLSDKVIERYARIFDAFFTACKNHAEEKDWIDAVYKAVPDTQPDEIDAALALAEEINAAETDAAEELQAESAAVTKQ